MNVLSTIKKYLFGTTRGLIFLTWIAVLAVQAVAPLFLAVGAWGWVLHLGLVLAVYFPLFSAAKNLDNNSGRDDKSLKGDNE